MKRYWPLLIISGVWLLVVSTNFTRGTWLLGWDSVNPEFNFSLNIFRNFFGVWQEYQGLGLVGGQGYIASLPHHIILLLTSLILPANTLRYFWQFLMLLLGPIGAYLLATQLFRKITPHHDTHHLSSYAALGSALFYLCNLATIQTFIVPYEAFTTFFAALPWLLWSAFEVLQSPSRRTYLMYGLINILGMMYAYSPTLFVVYFLLLLILSLSQLFKKKPNYSIKNIFFLMGSTFLLNALWLMPFLYFTLTSSHIVVDSKINKMATEEIYLRNHEYGNALDTLLLKNFLFDTTETNPRTSTLIPIMGPWQKYVESPAFGLLSLLGLCFIFSGVIYLGSKKQWPYLTIGIVAFLMIANATPPFSFIMDLLREHVPLLSQFFRFPFTKFGTILSLCYSLFFGVGILAVCKQFKKTNITKIFGVVIILIPLLNFLPTLTGGLFSPVVTQVLPSEYLIVMEKINELPDGRIAQFPLPSFWDWKYFRYGYVGSGFSWYGLRGSLMDNAFNSWSNYNENYYWEVSQAIYRKDAAQLASVLEKYAVRYVLFDGYLTSGERYQSLAASEIKNLLTDRRFFESEESIGNMSLFRLKNYSAHTNIELRQLPIIAPLYTWNDFDQAYHDFGSYIGTNDITKAQVSYPFRSFFSKRFASEVEVKIEEDRNELILGTKLPFTQNKENTLIFDSSSEYILDAKSVGPCVVNADTNVSAQNLSDSGKSWVRFQSSSGKNCFNHLLPLLNHDKGYIVAVESRHISGLPLLFSVINLTYNHAEIETKLDMNEDWQTSYFILPPLARDGLGYNLYFANESIGDEKSINDLARIRIFTFPYEQLSELKTTNPYILQITDQDKSENISAVFHPNPAEYWITFSNTQMTNSTLVLNQAFNKGWIGFIKTGTFPYFSILGNHVVVNNWANGWTLPSNQVTNNEQTTIYLFFWPQVLEWIGFILLPLPIIYAFLMKKSTHQHHTDLLR